MISLIFTRKKLLVGVSGRVTEFLEVDGNPFIEFGYRSPAEALRENLDEILNEYRYFVKRNGEAMPAEISLSILYPNDRPAAELAQIQEVISRDGVSLSIVHIDSLVLPYLYGMSHYDEIISEPCIVLEALDNYISLLYFHNPRKVNGSFLPIEENNLPTEYLKEKLSPQRLESMGIKQVFLLGKYLYNDFVLDFLENDLSLGDFIVRRNTSHLTDYKFMIKGSQRRMKDFSINPSERLADWNKTLARIQIPVSKRDYDPDLRYKKLEDDKEKLTGPSDSTLKLTGKVDDRSLEINQEINSFSNHAPDLRELDDLKSRLRRQNELYEKMAHSFDESNRRAQEANLRVRETEGEIKRLKKILDSKELEIETLKTDIKESETVQLNLENKTEELEKLQEQNKITSDLKIVLAAKEKELIELRSEIKKIGDLEKTLSGKEQEISELKIRLVKTNQYENDLETKNAEILGLHEQIKKVSMLETELSDRNQELIELRSKLANALELEKQLKLKQEEVEEASNQQQDLKDGTLLLRKQIELLQHKLKQKDASLQEKDEELNKQAEDAGSFEEIEREKNSLKQEMELLHTRYKIQQDLLINKDQEFAEYKDERVQSDVKFNKEIEERDGRIEELKEDIKQRQFKHNDELKVHLAEIDDLNSKVDAREHKISKLEKDKEKLNQQTSEVDANLNDRILELKAINVRLKVKELEVQELEQNLKSRESEIAELGDKMVDKNDRISERETENMKLKGELNSLKDKALSLELELKKSEGTIKVKEDEIVLLKKEINQQKLDAENIYRSHEKQVQSLEEKIKGLHDDINTGNEKIGQLETQMRLKDKEIQEHIEKFQIEKQAKQVLSDKLLESNKDKEELKQNLKDKTHQLDRALPELEKSKIRLLDLSGVIEKQRSAELEHKNQIVDQQKKIGTQEKDLETRAKELAQLKEVYVKTDTNLKDSKKKIEENLNAILNLNKTVEEKEGMIASLNESIKGSEDEIVELKAKLDLSTSRWADIGLALKGRDEHIIQLEDELTSLREVKKVLSQDLDQVNFELNDAKAKLEVYVAERNVAEARANELGLQVKRLEVLSTEKESEDETLSDLHTTIRNLNREITNREDKIQKYRTELGSKEKEIDQLHKRMESQREELAAANQANKNQEPDERQANIAALQTRLNIMKTELQAKEREMKEMAQSKSELNKKVQELEDNQSPAGNDGKFQKMIAGKNEVIRALKIKLGEKDRALKEIKQSGALTGNGKEQLVASKEARKFVEKIKSVEQEKVSLAEQLEAAQAQLEDQEALRKKLAEMEREMVVQRGRTKSRLEALEAELQKAFEGQDAQNSDLNSFNKFQRTV